MLTGVYTIKMIPKATYAIVYIVSTLPYVETDDIIAKIKSDLTGNTDKDKAYLIKQFKMHNLKEIHL